MFRYALLLLAITVVFASTSCKKTKPCEAIVTVMDPLGLPVAGARVILRQDSVINPTTGIRADILADGITAGNGEVHFEIKLEAVLNLEVSLDLLSAKDYIRLEQSELVRKTVVLK